MFDIAAIESGFDVRQEARAGMRGNTVGRAPGFVQANVFILPADLADDFEAFCDANPLACPLLARGEPGQTALPKLGFDIDIRTDLPLYHVHRFEGVDEVADITRIWKDDLVAFAVGCWFGAEEALARAGIRMRHRELGLQGGLYKTSRSSVSAGTFKGPLVVSMRPFFARDVDRVRELTSKMPLCHGAPLPEIEPGALGISDIARPDWGELVLPEPGEQSLFWPCGLTALAALEAVAPPLFITHAPGSMLVTDISEAS